MTFHWDFVRLVRSFSRYKQYTACVLGYSVFGLSTFAHAESDNDIQEQLMREKTKKGFLSHCKQSHFQNAFYATKHNEALVGVLANAVTLGMSTDSTSVTQQKSPLTVVSSPRGNGKTFVLLQFEDYLSALRTHSTEESACVIPMYISCKELVCLDRSLFEEVSARLQQRCVDCCDCPDSKAAVERKFSSQKALCSDVASSLVGYNNSLLLLIDDVEALWAPPPASSRSRKTQTQLHSISRAQALSRAQLRWIGGQLPREGCDGKGRVVAVAAGGGGRDSLSRLLEGRADPQRYPQPHKDMLGSKDSSRGQLLVRGLPTEPLTSFDSFQAATTEMNGADESTSGLLPLFRLTAFYFGNTVGHLMTVLEHATEDNTITPHVISDIEQDRQQWIASTLGTLHDSHFTAYLLYMELADALRAKNATLLSTLCNPVALRHAKAERDRAGYKGDELRGVLVDPGQFMRVAWETKFQPLTKEEVRQAWAKTCSRYIFLKRSKQLPVDTEPALARPLRTLPLNSTDMDACAQVLATLSETDLLYCEGIAAMSAKAAAVSTDVVSVHPVCLYQLLV